MKTRALFSLVLSNLRRNLRHMTLASVGVVVGICSFVFFLALGQGVRHTVATRIFPIEANRLEVVPRTAQLGALSGRVLDQEAVEELGRLPGVRAAYPVMKLQFLATAALDGRTISPAAIELLSHMPGINPAMIEAVKNLRLWLEIMAEGIDPRLVEKDAVAGDFADPAEGQPIPVLLSRRMVEIYNASFARERGLPRVSENVLAFLPSVGITLNHSFISRAVSGPSEERRVKIVGLSNYALMGGVSMPLETVRRLNRRFAGEEAARTYRAVILEVADSSQLAPVQEGVRALGFDIEMRERQLAESVGLLISVVTAGFSLISLVIVGLAALSIAHIFFMLIAERRAEIGLLRAIGASRDDIRSLVLSEAALVGAAGGLAGVVAGLLLCTGLDVILVRSLPDFPFKPDSFFLYPWWLIPLAVLFAVAFCLAGAVLPARAAATMPPAQAIAGR
jgi:putative ABC transport system permease protein